MQKKTKNQYFPTETSFFFSKHLLHSINHWKATVDRAKYCQNVTNSWKENRQSIAELLDGYGMWIHLKASSQGFNSRLQLNHTRVWQLPCLAQPGPDRDAIHWALLSLLISSTNLMATSLLPAASLAAGVIRPTLAKRHIAWALTAVVDKSRLYCPTTMPSSRSVSCLPVALTMCATFASAQL